MTPEWRNEPMQELFKAFEEYKIGETVYAYDPTTKEVRDMLYLIAYDITDPRRLRHVAKACEAFGIRVEYSVFECDLDEPSFTRLWGRLNRLITDDDALMAYRICRECVKKILTSGTPVRPGKVLCYMM